MASKNLTFLLVAILMLAIGVLVGYVLGGGKVVTVTTTVTTPITSPITTYTPSPATETITITYPQTSAMELIEVSPGQVVAFGSWRLAVSAVKNPVYVKELWSGRWFYFEAPQDRKIIIVTVRIQNAGTGVSLPPFTYGGLSRPVLVTDANRSYDYTHIDQLKYIPSDKVTKEIEQFAVEYRGLDSSAKMAPGTYIEADFMYLIPTTEKPLKVVMTYQPTISGPEITIVFRLS